MYNKLIRQLRNCAIESAPCKACDMVNDDSCTDRLMKQAADAIEELICDLGDEHNARLNAEERQRWIPVTERLPELHEEVIVCNEEYGRSELGFAMFAVWDGAGWIETWNRRAAIHCVSNWMPLPEPPKEEGHA